MSTSGHSGDVPPSQPPFPPHSPAYPPPGQSPYSLQYPSQPVSYPPQPPYGYSSPPQPPAKKGNLALVIIGSVVGGMFLLCVVCVALASALGKGSVTTTNRTGSATSAATSAASNIGTQSVAKVGDTITQDNVACTLISVKALEGDEFTQPKPGNLFVVVHVKLQNKTSSEVDYNPFDFHAKSGAGNITDVDFFPPSTYKGNDQLDAGKLSPGGTVEGDLVFQVPQNDHGAQLTWQPNFFGNVEDNVWNLGL